MERWEKFYKKMEGTGKRAFHTNNNIDMLLNYNLGQIAVPMPDTLEGYQQAVIDCQEALDDIQALRDHLSVGEAGDRVYEKMQTQEKWLYDLLDTAKRGVIRKKTNTPTKGMTFEEFQKAEEHE